MKNNYFKITILAAVILFATSVVAFALSSETSANSKQSTILSAESPQALDLACGGKTCCAKKKACSKEEQKECDKKKECPKEKEKSSEKE